MAQVCRRTWGVSFFEVREGHRWQATALVDADARFHGVVAEASAGPGREQRIIAEPVSFLEPDPQHTRCGRRERDAALLASLPAAADVRPIAEFDVTAGDSGELGESQTGLHGQHQQRTVAAALPPAQIRRGEQGVDFDGLEERHDRLVEPLLRDREHLLDQLGVLGVAQRGEPEQ